MIYHIIPLGEVKLHDDSKNCPCEPFVDHFEGNTFIKHWSLLTPEEEATELRGVRAVDVTNSQN